ncbi:hypothetical protein RBSH_04617 [Rhodopirellula baltica SH28]|uniref:Uncharacterized protein n=2 Tax=Rhodopirellula baltica TaxID=265606 RepID=K5CA50_RHOBT|nr:hypothetical protein RBSH_04617 [Rhodopirellula baltica SH28]ELP33270.1 hypothetical protein RBSWK_02767 [Rhodopirellula baltica SWK14]
MTIASKSLQLPGSSESQPVDLLLGPGVVLLRRMVVIRTSI